MTDHLLSEEDRPISAGAGTTKIKVRLAKDLVPLLSQQLYQSPIKAIEELAVNAFDADARNCWIEIDLAKGFVVIADDGVGMDPAGLQDLWMIGRSPKRRNEEYLKRVNRTQIGKFGIGKLAASAIAHKITYISRLNEKISAVTLDFRDFDQQEDDFELSVSVSDVGSSDAAEMTKQASKYGDMPASYYEENAHWTQCILTSLKEKSAQLSLGKLRWVLSTAMPLVSDFKMHLNRAVVSSSKKAVPIITYETRDFEAERIQRLSAFADQEFKLKDGKLVADLFPSGLIFKAEVYPYTLDTGKSADLGRSYGFFVRVRNRLVNERDANFGMTPRAFRTWNRFAATIEADDLDDLLTAPREGVEDAPKRDIVQVLAKEIFNACRARHDAYIADLLERERKQKEIGRNPVSSRLIEMPVADVIQRYGGGESGGDADSGWFFLDLPTERVDDLVKKLYAPRAGLYSYRKEDFGPSGPLVKYKPDELLFIMNESHPLVREFGDDYQSRRLLEDFVTAEAMLEVHLREAGISLSAIADVLTTRDRLIRTLAKSESYSLKNIAQEIRDSSGSKDDLEIAVVSAMRAFGFVAKHVAGAGRPDGLARYYARPGEEKRYTLEAKSTIHVAPSLGAIDFAGLEEHLKTEGADGCILVAPAFPGDDADGAAARRAKSAKVSCWTIENLAKMVEAADARRVSAEMISKIIEDCHSPSEVDEAVLAFLSEAHGDTEALEREILAKIAEAMERPVGANLDISYIQGMFASTRPDLQRETLERAIESLAQRSNGLLVLRGVAVVPLGSPAEIARRAWSGFADQTRTRRGGDFKGDGSGDF